MELTLYSNWPIPSRTETESDEILAILFPVWVELLIIRLWLGFKLEQTYEKWDFLASRLWYLIHYLSMLGEYLSLTKNCTKNHMNLVGVSCGHEEVLCKVRGCMHSTLTLELSKFNMIIVKIEWLNIINREFMAKKRAITCSYSHAWVVFSFSWRIA